MTLKILHRSRAPAHLQVVILVLTYANVVGRLFFDDCRCSRARTPFRSSRKSGCGNKELREEYSSRWRAVSPRYGRSEREQFRTAILLTIGLEVHQIADLLETTKDQVCRLLDHACRRAECRNVQELDLRLLYESENDLFEETMLKMELMELQLAARGMLDSISSMAARPCSSC
jgi:hypothetical protein